MLQNSFLQLRGSKIYAKYHSHVKRPFSKVEMRRGSYIIPMIFGSKESRNSASPLTFNGSRCQIHRTLEYNHCAQKCFNTCKCVLLNNTQQCLCPPNFIGSQCEQALNRITPRSSQCYVLKYRHRKGVTPCQAFGLTPLLDAHCECLRHPEKANSANCQLTPSAYSSRIFFMEYI